MIRIFKAQKVTASANLQSALAAIVPTMNTQAAATTLAQMQMDE
jgi:hypothetical protein